MKVFITDFIKNPTVEKKILKNNLIINQKYKFEAEILLVWHQKINENYINKFKKLKYVIRYGTGYDDIDLTALKKKNILFSNNPDYGTYEVSNTALAMILNISRQTLKYNQISKNLKKGNWQENFIKNIKSIKQTSVGVIGVGRIGSTLITKLNYIGYKTLFYDPFKDYGYEKVINSNRATSINDLLLKSDIVSINCDLNKDTQSLIDKKFISKMKKGSSLVNTARGKIISKLDDFYEPLKQKKINSVFLDVLPDEPPPNCKIIQSWKRDEDWISGRFLINPHSAFYSKETYQEMRKVAAKNALNFINKKNLKNLIYE